MDEHELTFPLVARRRVIGLAFGALTGARRGTGSDVAGSRAYRPGDDVDAIDWAASARLSSARGRDEFVVREHYAEEAPRVVVVCDRRPAMALFPPSLPWLSKPAVLLEAGDMIAASTVAARGFVGYLDYADGLEPFWLPPRSQKERWEIRERHLSPLFRAPEDNVTQAVEFLTDFPQTLPPGSFLFVLSDFLAGPEPEVWLRALEYRWDVVPVVVQDPLWEQSFPPLASIAVPLADPASGRVRLVRLSAKEARERRRRNVERLETVVGELRAIDLEPVVLGTSEREAILEAFLAWGDERLATRRRGW
jgi:uncharacterized protein (DUF58 family)